MPKVWPELSTGRLLTLEWLEGHRLLDHKDDPLAYLKLGDEVQFRVEGGPPRIVVVRALYIKRVGAPVATTAYEDNSPPLPPKEERVLVAVRDRGAGRPTKRDRRVIDRLIGDER